MYFPLKSAALTCIAVSAACAGAAAQSDTLLGTSASGDAVYFALLSEDAALKTVRTRLVYAHPRMVSDIQNVVASVSIEQIDCKRFTRKTERLELFTSLDPAAMPVWSKDLDSAQPQLTPVDLEAPTASTSVFKTACSITSNTVTANASLPASASGKSAAPPQTQGASPVDPTQVTTPMARSTPAMPTPRTAAAPSRADVATREAVRSLPSGTFAEPVNDASGTLATYRPYPDSVFTLGTMGLLAEYVYYDSTEYALLEATSSKMHRGRAKTAEDGKQHPILDEASRRIDERVQTYRDKMDAKVAFLSAAGLYALPLPVSKPSAPAAFRAELYKHQQSGELILVFRGTQGGMDWISNLWTGVDLLSIESPHYQAAYQLVAELLRRGMKPMVVGHSLGGGMSQYVGAKFGLKVVGFNSAPLPLRYLEGGQAADPHYIRLFSAVETVRSQGVSHLDTMPDPVSIIVPEYAPSLNQLFPDFMQISGHHLLSKPVCVHSVPIPTETPKELEAYDAQLGKVLSAGLASTVISGRNGKAIDQVALVDIRLLVRANMMDPVWNPDHAPGVDNAKVAKDVRAEVVNVAIEQYKVAGAGASLVKKGYKLAFSDSMGEVMSGLGSFAAMTGKFALRSYVITHFMQPHSMERFNRGMRSQTEVDVFLADPIRAQCNRFDTTRRNQ